MPSRMVSVGLWSVTRGVGSGLPEGRVWSVGDPAAGGDSIVAPESVDRVNASGRPGLVTDGGGQHGCGVTAGRVCVIAYGSGAQTRPACPRPSAAVRGGHTALPWSVRRTTTSHTCGMRCAPCGGVIYTCNIIINTRTVTVTSRFSRGTCTLVVALGSWPRAHSRSAL